MDFLSPTLPFIRSLQEFTWLDGPMKAASFLGSEPFFLFLLPFVFWCVSRGIGARLGLLLLSSVLINHVLKVSFADLRPYQFDSSLLRAEPETSFGFPSGHAQNAALVWPFLALQSKNWRLWLPLALLLALLIAFSRLYLGLHFPADAFGGALVGFALLWAFDRFEPRLVERWRGFSPATIAIWAGAFCAISLAAALFLSQTSDDTARELAAPKNAFTAAGALFGLSLGLALGRGVPFQTPRAWMRKIALFAFGALGLGVLFVGLGAFGGDFLLWRFVRYTLLLLWVVWLVPLLWTRFTVRSPEARVALD